MELSRTIGTVAVVLGIVLAAGFAVGEDGAPATKQAAPAATAQESAKTGQAKVEEREAQRRVALKEQQERKDAFERACNKPMKTDMDFDLCRTAYKRLQLTN